MDRAQRVKMINTLYNFTPDHARKVGDILEAELQQSRSSIDDEVQKNRTMHEMARAMHVISDSDNTAALCSPKLLVDTRGWILTENIQNLTKKLRLTIIFYPCSLTLTLNPNP